MEYNPVQTFLTEAEELLANIEQSALSLGEDESPAEAVNQLFRAFHTIKGSGAMCGLVQVSGFTHHVETLLDRVRGGGVAVSPELSDLVLAAADQIKLLLAVEQGGKPVAPESNQRLIDRISELSDSAISPNHRPVSPSAGKRAAKAKEENGPGRFGSAQTPTFSPVGAIQLSCSGTSES